MTCEMGLAVLAAKDLVRIQVDVVGEPHSRSLHTPGRLKADGLKIKI